MRQDNMSADEIHDLLGELEEKRQELAALKKRTMSAFRRINTLCNNPHWTTERRWTIAQISNEEIK